MPRSRRRCVWLLTVLYVLGCGAAPTQAEPARSIEPTNADSPRESSLGVRDVGIFSELDSQVQLALPARLDPKRVRAAIILARGLLVLYDGTLPVKAYPLLGPTTLRVGATTLALRPGDAAELTPLLRADRVFVFESAVELPPGDADGDGLPDPLDVLIGARKAALNADRYDGRYLTIDYPRGDVPRTIGVCTDVVVRSLRNAGYDLQQLVHEDILHAPRFYPMISKPNTNIDHRRVRSLLPYFKRNMSERSARLDERGDPLEPGDVIFMDTFPERPGSEHVGVIADSHSAQGQPLVINNWTDGTVTKPMDLLSFVPVTQRFRLPARLADAGPISALRTQLVTVVSDSWQAARGVMRRYERQPGRGWRPVGKPIPVVLGRSGYGWGDGVHGTGAPAGRGGPTKREGDGRSPAGVFELGTVYGYAPSEHTQLPYAQATATLRCVDDARAAEYNQVRVEPASGRPSWSSAERMRRDDDLYELALVIEHNRDPVTPGHGSCIFLHVWQDANTPVTGCTALDKSSLRALLPWFRPNAALLVALPASEYAAARRSWGLP